MWILLFLDFYSGDILGENPSWIHDLLMALLTALFSGVIIAWGINYERRKEKEETQEDLRLLLYNLHVHLNDIILGAIPIPEEYKEFVKEISQKRLDSSIVHRPRRQIPPMDRVLKMDMERIFQSFLVTYADKKQATLDFNNTFTCVDYLSRILKKLEEEYEDSMNVRFEEMQKFNAILIEIQRQLDHLGNLLKVDVSPLLKEAIETVSTNLEDYVNGFVTQTEKFLAQYEPSTAILLIKDEIKKLKESIKVILLRTEELENMLTGNVPEITSTIRRLTTLNSTIKESLERFMDIK